MGIKPDGDAIRSAVQWISEKRVEKKDTPVKDLIEAACLKFNLSPMESEFLTRRLTDKETDA